MKANDRRRILKKRQHHLQGADLIIQPDNITSASIEFPFVNRVLNSFIISRRATTTCVGDDGVPVLVSSLIFGYASFTAKTQKS